MRLGVRWTARQFVPLDGGVRGLGRLQLHREPENLLGTLWKHSPSRVTVPDRNPFAVVRYGRTDDLFGDMSLQSLTASDHGGRSKEVFEPSWFILMFNGETRIKWKTYDR
ncbi:hypothetical protein Taro_044894 [Colocasia esculenta]|uniref:Uncharacterized protein n=1 Tax=Colocasia esculenta TaxID=4460 RepID=A0A843WV65_COLES|nr:hypothetical protein [Colocasia esculenta]